jgi:hypothetical protein
MYNDAIGNDVVQTMSRQEIQQLYKVWWVTLRIQCQLAMEKSLCYACLSGSFDFADYAFSYYE